MSVTIDADGLPELARYLHDLPDVTTEALRLAINQTMDRRALPLATVTINSQVAFPKGYLKEAGRFEIAKRATNADLEAVLTARGRATSLARFLVGAPVAGKARNGVVVRVKPGESRVMKTAWVVRLPQGKVKDDDHFNYGIAIRVKDGAGLRNKKTEGQLLAPNVYLLYGPSVDQVFRGVASDIMNPVGDYLADEFWRQFTRLSGG